MLEHWLPPLGQLRLADARSKRDGQSPYYREQAALQEVREPGRVASAAAALSLYGLPSPLIVLAAIRRSRQPLTAASKSSNFSRSVTRSACDATNRANTNSATAVSRPF